MAPVKALIACATTAAAVAGALLARRRRRTGGGVGSGEAAVVRLVPGRTAAPPEAGDGGCLSSTGRGQDAISILTWNILVGGRLQCAASSAPVSCQPTVAHACEWQARARGWADRLPVPRHGSSSCISPLMYYAMHRTPVPGGLLRVAPDALPAGAPGVAWALGARGGVCRHQSRLRERWVGSCVPCARRQFNRRVVTLV